MPLMKRVRSAVIENKNSFVCYDNIGQLRMSTYFTPFSMLFQREPSTRLPQLLQSNNDVIDEQTKKYNEASKYQSKT
jgi:hypothetical protein